MRHIWLIALAAAVAGATIPPSVRVHFRIYASADLSVEQARVTKALQRGMFMDSLIVPTPDSVGAPTISEVRIRLLNILAQPMAGPDTLRVDRKQLDSAVTEIGRRYAQRLSRPHR
jgi:hypothetical protein